ncbi:MAG: ACT domain-containing protein [Anaerolineae bacterium]
MQGLKFRIGGIIQKRDLARISIMGIPDCPGVAGALLSALGNKDVNCAFVVHLINANNQDSIILCVAQDQLPAALEILEAIGRDMGAEEILYTDDVAMLAIFGPHFGERPGIAGAMFTALASAGIHTLAISTSISTVSCIIHAAQLDRAIQVLHEAFLPPRTSNVE